MLRRRYLRATGVGLASVIAGCNVIGESEETPTGTETATETVTESPTEDPVADGTVPDYIDLLPEKHLNGDKHTPNGNFVRVEWDWFLRNYDRSMTFGSMDQDRWTLEANSGNMVKKAPPDYAILHAPVGTTIQTGKAVANIMPTFPNLGPEVVRQCGFEMVTESGTENSQAAYTGADSAQIDEVVGYAKPGMTYFIGVDVDGIRAAVTANRTDDMEKYPDIELYWGAGIAKDRLFFLSEAWSRPVLCVETAPELADALLGPIRRVTGAGETDSAAALESVRWCLSEFVPDVPVAVGQVNGEGSEYNDTTYRLPPIRRLESRETVMHGFDTDGRTATAQVVASDAEGKPPSDAKMQEVYGPEDGEVRTTYHSHVSQLTTTWN